MSTSTTLPVTTPARLPKHAPPIALYAKWRFRYTNKVVDAQGKRSVVLDVYDLILPPATPLRIGSSIRVLGIGHKLPGPCPEHSDAEYRRKPCACPSKGYKYSAYDAKVEGTVVGIRVLTHTFVGHPPLAGPVAELIVENTRGEAREVRRVVVAAPCVWGRTIAADAGWTAVAETSTPGRPPIELIEWDAQVASW